MTAQHAGKLPELCKRRYYGFIHFPYGESCLLRYDWLALTAPRTEPLNSEPLDDACAWATISAR